MRVVRRLFAPRGPVVVPAVRKAEASRVSVIDTSVEIIQPPLVGWIFTHGTLLGGQLPTDAIDQQLLCSFGQFQAPTRLTGRDRTVICSCWDRGLDGLSPNKMQSRLHTKIAASDSI
ncbi:uncharacterized protein APUU_50808S [Aspergillus puulaauensis]|uniref:Uncharacterized protein n=1 Tax=Aspergillus puulaauensis TaxID=1220207 RepID=A0A7R8APM5_9EURO|nr:uncharacterized protein APUU_50808S [Aspergillus puulaauensis]BCS26097.1 hypothetical protein APUU_50808S [Aspergillus puulaauensis]